MIASEYEQDYFMLSNMDILRQRLINGVNAFLAQVISDLSIPANSQLHIEASLVHPSDMLTSENRVLLETIDVDQLRKETLNDRDNSTSINSIARSLSDIPFGSQPLRTQATGYSTANGSSSQVSLEFPPHIHPNHHPSPHGSLELEHVISNDISPRTDSPAGCKHSREDDIDQGLSKRPRSDKYSQKEQTAMEKFIEGIWEQIHVPNGLAMDDEVIATIDRLHGRITEIQRQSMTTRAGFDNITKCCRQVIKEGRVARFLEVVMQAYWVDRYDERLAALKIELPNLRAHEHKRKVLTEACESFGWSEKELRNKTAVWKGYREIKDAAGWSALIFASAGIYRFCKYRLGFDHASITKLQNLRTRAEVAVDTLQPQWRRLLSLVGQSTTVRWPGHPHDWTVSLRADEEPLPLALTYQQWDLNFSFENIQHSRIDTDVWAPGQDPRKFEPGPDHFCKSCTLRQSPIPSENQCECFPDLYGTKPLGPCPVQIFQTPNGKNNGLIACCTFAPGQAVGEFVGLITKGLADVDVMQSQAGDNEPYQIWQGRCGNFTRFMNHSCAPNCQFQTFSWLGVQRIVVVSKGIGAGQELTVDYSARYWDNLDKICLCGEACCRYKDRRKRVGLDEVDVVS